MFPPCTPFRLISPKEPAASFPPEVWMSSRVSCVGVPKVGLHVGLLPRVLAYPLARLEPYGLLILIGALILLPLLGAQLGLNLDVISTILRTLTGYVLGAVLFLTGNT